jgi:uncharacterized membrane protein YhdT
LMRDRLPAWFDLTSVLTTLDFTMLFFFLSDHFWQDH